MLSVPHSGKMLRDANHNPSYDFEHLHDLCMVRTLEVPQFPVVEGHCRELVDRFGRMQVPANRIGSYQYSTAQLKTIQEVITLAVFGVFSITYLGETLKWNHAVAFLLIIGAVFFMFYQKA